MSKKNPIEYEHHVPKFLQIVMNRNQKSNEDEERIRNAKANIDRGEDLGEEAPQIVDEDSSAIKEFQEAKIREEEKRKKEEELRIQEIREAEEKAKILEKSKFSITDTTGHVFRSKSSSNTKNKSKSKESKKKKTLSFQDSEESEEDIPKTKIVHINNTISTRKETDSESSVEDKSSEKDASKSSEGQSLFKKRKRPNGIIVTENEKNSKTKLSNEL
jgi:hypothetical protein